MEELLQKCSQGVLAEAIQNACAMLNVENVTIVKNAICESLTKEKREEQRQQEEDQKSFAVVLGACDDLGVVANPTLQLANRERGRFYTGLMAVGSDVLKMIFPFLAWEKLELQRKWEVKYVVQCLCSPCGNLVLTRSGGNISELKLWDAARGELVRDIEAPIACSYDCCFSPDGKTIVSADDDTMLRLWDVESGTLSRTLEGHTDEVFCVDVSPDGTTILSGSMDGTAKFWNLKTDPDVARGGIFECALSIEFDFGASFCSFSPNGAFFFVGGGDCLKLYDSKTYQLHHSLEGHSDDVGSGSFAPDGATLLSGSYDSTLKLWCTTTGGLLRTLYGHTEVVTSCAFSPAGLTIVSSSEDRTVRLWTAATGQLQRVVEMGVHSFCFSPDGKSISLQHIGAVSVWSTHRSFT
jgi:WD40 repeat protein